MAPSGALGPPSSGSSQACALGVANSVKASTTLTATLGVTTWEGGGKTDSVMLPVTLPRLSALGSQLSARRLSAPSVCEGGSEQGVHMIYSLIFDVFTLIFSETLITKVHDMSNRYAKFCTLIQILL